MRRLGSAGLAVGMAMLIACNRAPADTDWTARDPRASVPAATPASAASTLTLSASASTTTTLTLRVCAGSSGAPAGFSVQWMTAAQFAGYGSAWPEYTDTGREFCKASFSGMARDSRFALAPDACVDLAIGNLPAGDPGQSYTCNEPLTCGTEHVFRAFAHADSSLRRSEFTPEFVTSTLATTMSDPNGTSAPTAR